MEDKVDPSPTQSSALPSQVEETKGSSITKLRYTRKGKPGHSPASRLLCQGKTIEYYASFGLRHMILWINQVQSPSTPEQVVPESSLEEDSDGCKRFACSKDLSHVPMDFSMNALATTKVLSERLWAPFLFQARGKWSTLVWRDKLPKCWKRRTLLRVVLARKRKRILQSFEVMNHNNKIRILGVSANSDGCSTSLQGLFLSFNGYSNPRLVGGNQWCNVITIT